MKVLLRNMQLFSYFKNKPRLFTMRTDRFKEAVQEVKSRGLDPCTYAFFEALVNVMIIRKAALEEKMNAYRKWGWTDEELDILYKKNPKNFIISVKKINAGMDYLTRMGYSLSDFGRTLEIFSHSLEKSLIPRVAVYRYLISIHFIESLSIVSLLTLTEDAFLKRFVIEFEEEVPEVWQIYKQAFKKSVMEEGVQGSAVKNEVAQEEEEIAAAPLDEKVLEDSQPSVLKKKVGLDNKVEELEKDKRPKKVLKSQRKK